MRNGTNTLCAQVAVAALLLSGSGCEAEDSEGIGARGGVIVSPDQRFEMDVPEGALAGEIQVTIGAVDGPAGAQGMTYEVEPRGTMFRVPATVTWDFSSEDPNDLDLGELEAVAERNGAWMPLPDLEIDKDAMTVSASAMYLSAYALVRE